MNTTKIGFLSLLISMLLSIVISAQSEQKKFRIYFKDKTTQSFDPYQYFDQAAINRRIAQNLPLYDYHDLPVNENYVQALINKGCSVKMISRWLNAAVVFADDQTISLLNDLKFIAEIETAPSPFKHISEKSDESMNQQADLNFNDLKILKNQTSRMGAELLDAMGLNGKGIRICINDVGFSGVESNPAFAHLRGSGQIKKTKDFVDGGENVYRGGWHGTAVLSCIAGIIDGSKGGLATDAEFLLARTEWGNKEIFAEEENWVAAAEWADQNGARIINSSLGYTEDRYFPRQMDGKHSFITRGANIAAKKGMLIVNAAGNEGSGKWRIMGAPADADSVMSVGGVNPFINQHSNFASYGPTSDLRLKPNVSAQAIAIAAVSAGAKKIEGTSFAAPLVTGFAACLWQHFPEKSNMEIFKMIELSGHLSPYFDYAHGFGVPSAVKIFQERTIPENSPIQIIKDAENPEKLNIEIITFEPADSLNTNSRLLYYHLADHRNVLISYFLVDVKDSKTPVKIDMKDYPNAKLLRVFYKDYLFEYSLKP